jgi:L-amino acid N-acyltransferase YncA
MPKPLRLASFEPKNEVLMTSILVREVVPKDELAILEIRNHADNYKWFFEDNSIPVDEHAKWFETRLLESRFFTLVAEIEGSVVGTAYLTNLKSTIPKVSISVNPGSKAKGVGHALLNELIKRCKSANLKSIYAEVKTSNVASIYFFSKNGFVLTNSNFEKQSVPRVDAILFSINLDD